MRVCRHTSDTTVPGCSPCLLWATHPEYYCLFEELPPVLPPPEVIEARRKKFTLWKNPEVVRQIAEVYGRPVPVVSTDLPAKPKVTRENSPKTIVYKDYGPGTELKGLLEGLGITDTSGCGCKAKARVMNEWGVEGCLTHRDEIAKWLREEWTKRGWKDTLSAAFHALTTADFLPNPLDPVGSIVDEAIRRARVKEEKRVVS